ncbi:MAG TPA: dienelactone hydrolase family protein [Gemmatimonadaceae bacterium]|nr:dienelactone hydrolase family protein [Gemmatimonadaceae bacterium]
MKAGVLVLHPWWGVNDDVRAAAERLRGEGYEVATPDLFHGRVAKTIEEAKTLSGEVDKNSERTMSEIGEAHAKLSAQADRIAVLAWSMGVWYSWQLAQAHPDKIRGLVSYYGYGEVEPGKTLPPILGHFAEDDEFEALADVRSAEQKVVENGGVAQFHVYPGTKHWFDEPSRPEFDKDASALAFERTLAFLDRHLRR